MDEFPTEDSHNLVESGGVAVRSFSLLSEINYTDIIEGKVIKGGEIISASTPSDFNIYSFPINGGTILCVELNKSVPSLQEIAYMDDNDNIISTNTLDSSLENGAKTHIYVMVPDNATKMLVLKFRSRPIPVVHIINLNLSNLKSFIKRAEPLETIEDYYVNRDGGLSYSEGRATETYSVKAGDTYFIDVDSLGNLSTIFAFYNSETPSSDTFIPNVLLVGDSQRRKIQVVVPTGAVRMRICFNKNKLNYRSVYYSEGIDLANYPIISELLTDINSLETTLIGSSTIEYSEQDLVPGYYDTRNLTIGDTINDSIHGKSDTNLKCGKFTVKAGDVITIYTSMKPSTGGRPYVLTDSNGITLQLSELGSDYSVIPALINVVDNGFLFVCEKLSSMSEHTFSVQIQRMSTGVIPVMQKEIDEINANIHTADSIINYTELKQNGFYFSPDIEIGSLYVEKIGGKSDDNLLCERFNVMSGDIVTLCTSMGNNATSSKARPYFLTNKDKVVTALTPVGSNTFPFKTFTVEDDGYMYVCEKLSVMGDYTFSLEIRRIFDYSRLPEMQDDINKLKAGIIVDDEIPLSVVKETPGLTAILHRIGVVGASLTNGGQNTTDGSFPTEAGREYSWPQRLARLCGITCFNFGASGFWCKRWLENVGGYYEAVADPENKCDAYIISLASNDIYEKSGYHLGTIEDVHVGNESENGDSYYGYFSQVIARCHEVQQRAYLFVLTYPHGFGTTESGGYTQAMRDIVELYRNSDYNIYLIDYASYGMTVDEAVERGLKRSAHYVGAGYQYMTYEICTYIDWIIRHNIEDFKDISFVRTTAEFVPKGETPVGYNQDDYFIGPDHRTYLNIDYRRPRFYYTKDEVDAMIAELRQDIQNR